MISQSLRGSNIDCIMPKRAWYDVSTVLFAENNNKTKKSKKENRSNDNIYYIFETNVNKNSYQFEFWVARRGKSWSDICNLKALLLDTKVWIKKFFFFFMLQFDSLHFWSNRFENSVYLKRQESVNAQCKHTNLK